MSKEQAAEAVETLGYISKKLREAISATLPCAQEQYLTISIPGLVIDTRDDGKGDYIITDKQQKSHDRKNEVACNEARLVDSMIPLDTVMLGPTGKSVTRSYLAALDHLVPRKTDIGSTALEVDYEAADSKKPPTTKYGKAMAFLKSTESSPQVGTGKIPGPTVVDRYVEKQIAWAAAQGKWVGAKAASEEATKLSEEAQTVEAFTARQEQMAMSKAMLNASWMDWVVNGNKFRVDHSFGLVDRDTIMGRIEKAKETTRNQTIMSANGLDWAAVSLEPSNWAAMCAEKARDWGGLKNAEKDSIELQISRLKQELIAYDVYEKHHKKFADNGIVNPLAGNVSPAELATLKGLREQAIVQLANAPSDAVLIKAHETADTNYNNKYKLTPEGAVAEALGEIYTAKDKLEDARATVKRIADAIAAKPKPDATAEEKLAIDEAKKKADEDTAKIKTENGGKSPSDMVTAAEVGLENAKRKWQDASANLHSYQTLQSVRDMAVAGSSNIADTAKSRRKAIEDEITELELKRGKASSVQLPDAILGVDSSGCLNRTDSPVAKSPGTELVKKSDPLDDTKPATTTTPGAETPKKPEKTDVWTKVTFSIAAKSDSNSTDTRDWSGGAKAKYSGFFLSAEASSSWSSSSSDVKKKMAECSVDGSFSALLVQIKRPWLHADLFSDYSINTMEGSRLSPGAQDLKAWMSKGESTKLAQYSEFPSYPTAFIVAADTVLELKTGDADSAMLMTSLKTDSSAKASYGPWGISGDASLKTSNETSKESIEMKNGKIKISFQAPQIIGWVSEILPQLPRDEMNGMGGLCGGPTAAFRSKL